MQSWYEIDGRLPEIDFDGQASSRLPAAMAEIVIRSLSCPGDVVIDPFAGFGTVVGVATRYKRIGIGIEPDRNRCDFARGAFPEAQIIQGRAENMQSLGLPPGDLIFCSPPFDNFNGYNSVSQTTEYLEALADTLLKVSQCLSPKGLLGVEMVNVTSTRGDLVPIAFAITARVSQSLRLLRDLVFCNSDYDEIRPGCSHSYISVFSR